MKQSQQMSRACQSREEEIIFICVCPHAIFNTLIRQLRTEINNSSDPCVRLNC